jgi:hypothetical protein
MLAYSPRTCPACHQRIPRWKDGKPTPVSKIFCSDACRKYHRRLHPRKAVREKPKNRPISSAFVEPFCAAEGPPEYGTCEACGRGGVSPTSGTSFCSTRCASYQPAPPRRPDGAWFTVAGPIDHCARCGGAIIPRQDGLLIPFRNVSGELRCSREACTP